METAMLAAFENRDNEAYTFLKARQDARLAHATVQLQDLQVQQAKDSVQLARLQQERAQIQATHYQELLNVGISPLEAASLSTYGAVAALKMAASAAGSSGGAGLL